MPVRKVKLGLGLPPFSGDIPAPDAAYLDRLSAQWDEFVPELAGYYDTKPMGWTGTPAPKFFRNKNQTVRASDGKIVTLKEIMAGMEKYMRALRG